jgi:hypothetical protein
LALGDLGPTERGHPGVDGILGVVSDEDGEIDEAAVASGSALVGLGVQLVIGVDGEGADCEGREGPGPGLVSGGGRDVGEDGSAVEGAGIVLVEEGIVNVVGLCCELRSSGG